MVDQTYYDAYQAEGTSKTYPALKASINMAGELKADKSENKYDHEVSSHYDIAIGSWAYGPLLFVEYTNTKGETDHPSIGRMLSAAVVNAGFIPFGFRPETERSDSGGREHTGRWMWYLRPISDIEDGYPEETYALHYDDEGGFVRNSDGDLVEFDSAKDAAAVADGRDDVSVKNVVQG